MKRVAPYYKAVVGFIAPGAALVIANGGSLDSHDWLVVLATCIVSGAAVAVVPNQPAEE